MIVGVAWPDSTTFNTHGTVLLGLPKLLQKTSTSACKPGGLLQCFLYLRLAADSGKW